MKLTKTQQIERAALRLRVFARKSRTRVNADMAWDAIAEVQTEMERQGVTLAPLAAKDVLRVARRQLKADYDYDLI